MLFKFAHRKTKEPFVSITNRSLVGTLITTGGNEGGNELEKFVSSNNRQVDHENAQFSVEEVTEGLFSFDHSDEHQEVSICSLEKET